MRLTRIIPISLLLLLLGVAMLAGSWSGHSRATPADAARNGEHFDIRDFLGPDDEDEPSGEQLAALDELKARAGANVRADFDRLSGTPRSVSARGSFLSGPSAGRAETIAGDFLADNAALFEVSGDFVAGLKETRTYVSDLSGTAHLEYAQEHDGLPVFQSSLRVAVTDDGRVLNVAGDYHPSLPALDPQPRLSEAEALETAFSYAGPPLTAHSGSTVSEAFAPTAELIVFPLAAGDATLAWRVLVPHVVAYWDVVVDADDGTLLYKANLTADAGPEGQVFAEHPDASTLTTVPFIGTLPTPRAAWVAPTSLDSCNICTNGNNVAAISDRLGDFTGPLASDPDAHFDSGFADAWALTGNPDADEASSITSLFYFVNVAHDHFYDLGFTEAAGNFQSKNFGGGGLGGDPVVATTYTGYDTCPYLPEFNCLNNAFFSTPPEGSIPLLASFLFTDPPFAHRDPSFDGDVMLHEYAHGVTNRIVGVGALTGVQSGALAEGWSDYFAISFFDDPVMGEYSTQNAAIGIRRFSYDASPLTYGDLCSAGCEIHADGEIWAATLWDLRQLYVGDLGLAAGGVAADRLVVDALFLTPPLPSMLDARDAILQAELSTGGANQLALWRVFANRGMGCSATSTGNTDAATEAFDIPIVGVCYGDVCDSPASPLAIPDNDPAGVNDTIVRADPGTITDLRVCLSVTHPLSGDISASLTHVNTGTTVTLVDRPGEPSTASGCAGSDILAILDDAAATAIEDECAAGTPTIEGRFTPGSPLSAFDGEAMAGDWRLTVIDGAATSTGSLTGWSLMAVVDPSAPTPTPTPAPDQDGDGVADALDNCPLWHNPTQSLPPWPIPADDPDCDGFDTSTETFLGTDPFVHCAATPATNDENPPDRWPLDMDDSQHATVFDVAKFIPALNSLAPGPPYKPRLDLNESGSINVFDLVDYIGVLNQFCT